MYAGEVVFAQLMEFLPRHEFDRCVRRYRGNRRVRKFSCRDQFLCMAFAQLSYRSSHLTQSKTPRLRQSEP